MALKIHLFGQLKEIVGSSVLEIEARDTDALFSEMTSRFPKLKNMPCLIAVDKTIIQTNTIIIEGQYLALMPPYSGG